MTDPRAAGDLTRRALLGTAAAAGAASLVLPAEGLASALTGPTGISSRWVGSVDRRAVTITAPVRFALVGVGWGGPRTARIELRTRTPDGEWGRWALASILGHGPDGGPPIAHPGAARGVSLFGEAIWTGTTNSVSARRPTDPRRQPALRQRARDVERIGGQRTPASPPRTRRRAGAAADHRALGVAGRGAAALPGRLRLRPAGVRPPHRHSRTVIRGDVPAMLMSIYRFHRYVRGWNNIG